MKTIIYIFLSFSLIVCTSLTLNAQVTNLNIEGEATSSRLVKFDVTDLSGSQDILELEAPSGLTGTTGQFIECQYSGFGLGLIKMQVNYDGTSFFASEMNINGDILLDDEGTQSSAEILMEDNSDNETIIIRTKDGSLDIGGEILLYGGNPIAKTIEIDGNWAGTGNGRIITDELQIDGGSDISENFEVATEDEKEKPQAGMLLSIDPDAPGQLKVTQEAYDSKIAGIISGANGIKTGLYMGQKGSVADGDYPVALAGRVYVLADASFGAIQPGDMLTSSSLPGYAMKVKKYKKAQGAIVGKAMTPLKEGQGYVLVLVNLQ